MKPILLLLLLHSVLGNPSSTRQSCLSQINSLRREYAQKYKIANMNHLVYDRNMEKMIMKTLEDYGGCPNGNRLILLVNEDGAPEISEIDDLFGSDSSKLACFVSRCQETGEDVHGFVLDSGSSPMLHGPPGTQCPQDKPINNDGLCASRRNYQRKKFVFFNPDWHDLLKYGKMCVVGPCNGAPSYDRDNNKSPTLEEILADIFAD